MSFSRKISSLSGLLVGMTMVFNTSAFAAENYIDDNTNYLHLKDGRVIGLPTCTNRKKQDSLYALVNLSEDVAKATYNDDGLPVIIFNKRTIHQYSTNAIHALKLHECAHQVLGHVLRGQGYDKVDKKISYRTRVKMEIEADCFATNILKKGLGFSKGDVSKAFDDMYAHHGDEKTFMALEPRKALALTCF